MAKLVPLYRYYCRGTSMDSFYTTNWDELGEGSNGYILEGVQCYVWNSPIDKTTPLYRYFNGSDHFYTTNWNELKEGNGGWKSEGIACHIYPPNNKIPGTVPLYRFYSESMNDHFYTTIAKEKEIHDQSYKAEQIPGCVFPSLFSQLNQISIPNSSLRMAGICDDIIEKAPTTVINYLKRLFGENSPYSLLQSAVKILIRQKNLSGEWLDNFIKPIKIFYSYSHKDEKLRESLEKHLKPLINQKVIEDWYDRKILPGTDWEKEINNELESADIILFLLSVDFLASDYINKFEVKRALELHEKGDTVVLPIMLKRCDRESSPFADFQGLPEDFEPVTSKKWDNKDEAFYNIVEGLKKIIKRIQEKRLAEWGCVDVIESRRSKAAIST